MTAEIGNLGASMIVGFISATLSKLFAEREAEKKRLMPQIQCKPRISANILPAPPALMRMFMEKAARLSEVLNEEKVRGEAAEILSRLIESVTIYPCADGFAEAEVVAKVSDLMAWTTNANAAPNGGVCSSMAVVAGSRLSNARHLLEVSV